MKLVETAANSNDLADLAQPPRPTFFEVVKTKNGFSPKRSTKCVLMCGKKIQPLCHAGHLSLVTKRSFCAIPHAADLFGLPISVRVPVSITANNRLIATFGTHVISSPIPKPNSTRFGEPQRSKSLFFFVLMKPCNSTPETKFIQRVSLALPSSSTGSLTSTLKNKFSRQHPLRQRCSGPQGGYINIFVFFLRVSA